VLDVVAGNTNTLILKTYDPARVAACFEAYAKAPCSPVRPNLAVCALLGEGKVAEGALCRVRDECGAHGYCHAEECLPNRPACCTGICVPLPGNTDTPACSDPCPEGTWCLSPGDAAGGAPACRPLAQAGESCAARPCAGEKLLCSDGICRPLGAPGDACKDSGRCLPWTTCVGGTCRAKSRPGEVCSHTDDCTSGACTSGTCAAAPRKHPCNTPIADDVYGCIDNPCPRDAGPPD
jgi:hypothetical protein